MLFLLVHGPSPFPIFPGYKRAFTRWLFCIAGISILHGEIYLQGVLILLYSIRLSGASVYRGSLNYASIIYQQVSDLCVLLYYAVYPAWSLIK